ncbi:MAG: hypothetical protein LUC43_07865 [Burkholderiales bacterium]|nr:hypothetical protein [Burkholderiales bacterium]
MVLLALLLVPSRLNRYIQQLALVIYGLEWVWTTYVLYEQRIAMGRPYITAVCILLGVAIFTFLTALVFQTQKLKNYYGNWIPTLK